MDMPSSELFEADKIETENVVQQNGDRKHEKRLKPAGKPFFKNKMYS
jgi:hypothetical protein